MAKKISAAVVRADFNDLTAVVHYARAAHELGLWASEKAIFDRYLPDPNQQVLELGCGAGRVTLGLWERGFRRLVGLDFSDQLIEQAVALAQERHASAIAFHHADATRLPRAITQPAPYDAVLFMFNGLMQIPHRRRRRQAMRQARRVVRDGARFIFTTHDRDDSATERALWRLETTRWSLGLQDQRLAEFGDRYFEDEAGRTFMHLPTRAEILEDLAATGWHPEFDSMRRHLARESKAVRDFSDECRFWVATAGKTPLPSPPRAS